MYKIINGELEHELLSIQKLDDKFVVTYLIKREDYSKERTYISKDEEEFDFNKLDKYMGVVE